MPARKYWHQIAYAVKKMNFSKLARVCKLSIAAFFYQIFYQHKERI